jgi:hypothetical protein
MFIRTIICVSKNTDNLDETLKSAPCNANCTYLIKSVKCFALLKSKNELPYMKIFAVTIMKYY